MAVPDLHQLRAHVRNTVDWAATPVPRRTVTWLIDEIEALRAQVEALTVSRQRARQAIHQFEHRIPADVLPALYAAFEPEEGS